MGAEEEVKESSGAPRESEGSHSAFAEPSRVGPSLPRTM